MAYAIDLNKSKYCYTLTILHIICSAVFSIKHILIQGNYLSLHIEEYEQ